MTLAIGINVVVSTLRLLPPCEQPKQYGKLNQTRPKTPVMNEIKRPRMNCLLVSIGAAILMGAALGCATGHNQTESQLAYAGFKRVPAATPLQEQQLLALPPGKVSKVLRKGNIYYVYPDRRRKVLYVGKPDQYQTYQFLVRTQQQYAADQKVSLDSRTEAEVNVQEDVLSSYGTPW